MIDHNIHRIEKGSLLHKIKLSLKRICTGSADTCRLGHCIYFKQCYNNADFHRHKKLKLKSIYKNLCSHENKIKGRRNPSFLGNNPHEIAETILGQSIPEHTLVKSSPPFVLEQFRMATSLSGIYGIFEMLHQWQYGKKKFPDNIKFKR